MQVSVCDLKLVHVQQEPSPHSKPQAVCSAYHPGTPVGTKLLHK